MTHSIRWCLTIASAIVLALSAIGSAIATTRVADVRDAIARAGLDLGLQPIVPTPPKQSATLHERAIGTVRALARIGGARRGLNIGLQPIVPNLKCRDNC